MSEDNKQEVEQVASAPTGITFNDKEYLFETMSDKSKYLTRQLLDVENQIKEWAFRKDQLDAMKAQFNGLLKLSLDQDEKEAEATDAEAVAADQPEAAAQ